MFLCGKKKSSKASTMYNYIEHKQLVYLCLYVVKKTEAKFLVVI